MNIGEQVNRYIEDGQYGRILKKTLPFGMFGNNTTCIWVLPKDVTVKKTNPGRDDNAVLVFQDDKWIRNGKWQADVDVLIQSGMDAEVEYFTQSNNSNSAAVKEAEIQILLDEYTNDT